MEPRHIIGWNHKDDDIEEVSGSLPCGCSFSSPPVPQPGQPPETGNLQKPRVMGTSKANFIYGFCVSKHIPSLNLSNAGLPLAGHTGFRDCYIVFLMIPLFPMGKEPTGLCDPSTKSLCSDFYTVRWVPWIVIAALYVSYSTHNLKSSKCHQCQQKIQMVNKHILLQKKYGQIWALLVRNGEKKMIRSTSISTLACSNKKNSVEDTEDVQPPRHCLQPSAPSIPCQLIKGPSLFMTLPLYWSKRGVFILSPSRAANSSPFSLCFFSLHHLSELWEEMTYLKQKIIQTFPNTELNLPWALSEVLPACSSHICPIMWGSRKTQSFSLPCLQINFEKEVESLLGSQIWLSRPFHYNHKPP